MHFSKYRTPYTALLLRLTISISISPRVYVWQAKRIVSSDFNAVRRSISAGFFFVKNSLPVKILITHLPHLALPPHTVSMGI